MTSRVRSAGAVVDSCLAQPSAALTVTTRGPGGISSESSSTCSGHRPCLGHQDRDSPRAVPSVPDFILRRARSGASVSRDADELPPPCVALAIQARPLIRSYWSLSSSRPGPVADVSAWPAIYTQTPTCSMLGIDIAPSPRWSGWSRQGSAAIDGGRAIAELRCWSSCGSPRRAVH